MSDAHDLETETPSGCGLLQVVSQKTVESDGITHRKCRGEMNRVQSSNHRGKRFARTRKQRFRYRNDMQGLINPFDVPAERGGNGRR